ncbi:MAG TPA: terminase family protein [Anaerolineales bacterium]|nr:terminase family protein [Anaerolineales bacterium]
MNPGPSDRLAFLIEYLDLAEATGESDATWQRFQVADLTNSSLLAIDRKARQVGWSWTAAAEAVAEGILIKRHTAIFVSINQDEAKEKVRYARQIVEALDSEVRPRLVSDNATDLEFANGSRLISHPCRPVRGKAKATVYLDEFAHYPKDREIYAAALPVTTRGGRMRIGSSPLGASGLFWEIFSEKTRRYPGYRRHSIPWWEVDGLCKDVQAALQKAPKMLTEERVHWFGTERLATIFENMPTDDFGQEYELAEVDEQVAWITWEEIKHNQEMAQAEKLWYRHADSVETALRLIDEAAEASRVGAIEAAFAGGMDIGRRKDLTELAFVGKGTTSQLPCRLAISLAKVPFDDQRAVATKALEILPVTSFLIDQNGIGMQIAEELTKAFPGRAAGVDFTNATKELWAVELKVRMQRGEVPIPLERELSYQIHSIKRKVTMAKNTVFDTEGNEKHHADKFWALALAVWAAKSPDQTELSVRWLR